MMKRLTRRGFAAGRGITSAFLAVSCAAPYAHSASFDARSGVAGRTAADHSKKSDTPEATYQLNVDCASIAAAAVASTHASSQKYMDSAHTILSVTRQKAQASGKILGFDPDHITKDIERGTDGLLKKVRQSPDPAQVKKEEADLGRNLIRCAIVQMAK